MYCGTDRFFGTTVITLMLVFLSVFAATGPAEAKLPQHLADQVITTETPSGPRHSFDRGVFSFQASDGTFEDGVELSWSEAHDLDFFFRLYRDGDLLTELSSQDSTYFDSAVHPLVVHEYSITLLELDEWESEIEAGSDSGSCGFFNPQNVTASDFFDLGAVAVSWEDRSEIESGFIVYRDGAILDSLDANSAAYSDTSAVALQEYSYCVSAYLNDGTETEVVGTSVAMPGATDVVIEHRVLESASYAYIADETDGFVVQDVTDPTNPTIIGSYEWLDSASGIAREPNFGYICVTDDNGFTMFDMTDPSNPVNQMGYERPGQTEDIVITPAGSEMGPDYVYVAYGSEGVDISSAVEGFWSVILVDTPGYATGLEKSGDHLFVADGSGGLQIIDVSNPWDDAVIVGSVALPGLADNVAVVGDYAYITAGTTGIHVVDVSDVALPVLVGTASGGIDARDIKVRGHYAFVTDGAGGISTYNIKYPDAPALVRSVAGSGAPSLALAVSEQYAYVASDTDGLDIFALPYEAMTDKVCDPGTRGTIDPPTDFTATWGYYTDQTIITWTDNTDEENGYRVEYPSFSIDLPANTTTWTDNNAANLNNEVEYTVYVLDSGNNPTLGGSVTGIFGIGQMHPPTNFAVSQQDDYDDRIRLTWDDAPDEDFYTIYRYEPEVTEHEVIATVAADVLIYDDLTAVAEVEYWYVLVAESDFGGTSVEDPIFVEGSGGMRDDILPPGNVQATDGDHESHVAITWENRSEKTAYFRISREGVPILTVAATATSTNHYEVVSGGANDQDVYMVEAVTALGIASGASDLGYRELKMPTSFAAEDGVAENRILLTWQDNSLIETGYRIWRDNIVIGTRTANRTAFTDDTAIPGVSHTYKVAAYDAYDESVPAQDDGIRHLLAPTNVTAADGESETEVVIYWEDNSGGETGYVVKRDGTPIGGTLPADSYTYTDTNETFNANHLYTVEAVDAYGSSEAVGDYGKTAILPPGSMAVHPYTNYVILTWIDESEINTGYKIYRDGQLIETSNNGDRHDWQVNGGTAGQVYDYCVEATLNGVSSTPACAEGGKDTVDPTPPDNGWVTDVAASDGTYDNRVRIEWTDTYATEDGFHVYRDGQLLETLEADKESFNDFDAEPGAVHLYQITAFDGATTSTQSDFGWRPPDGSINGRITTISGAAVDSVTVSLEPSPNRSLFFDGVYGRIWQRDDGAANWPYDQLTLEHWLKTDEPGSENCCTIDYETDGHGNEFGLVRIDDSWRVWIDGSSTTMSSGDDVFDGEWHHLAVTWDSNVGSDNLTFYVDGVPETVTFKVGATLDQDVGDVNIGMDHGLFYKYLGLLDEMRIWNLARTEAEILESMNQSLTGNEYGLIRYWPMDAGKGTGIADLSGNGNEAGFIGGVAWADIGSPLSTSTLTNIEGNFSLPGLRYGSSTTFRVTPTAEGHAFDPGFKSITLDNHSPVQNEVGFHDISSFSLTGSIAYAAAAQCGQEGVEIYLDDVFVGTTRSNGSYSIAAQPGERVIEARLEGNTFYPESHTITVGGNQAGLNFENTSTRKLSGRIGGGCDFSIGTWRFDVLTEDGCHQTTITSDGEYELQLTAQKYIVVVDDVVVIPPSPLSDTDILEFFQNVGSYEVDLTYGDQTLDLIYKAPLTMEVTGFPAPCGSDFYEPLPGSGVTSVAAPVIAQLQEVPLTIRVYENYGGGNTCPVDSGTVTVWDEIRDIASTPIVLEIVDGEVSYTTIGNKPNVTPGRLDAQGNNRSFQKPITFAAEVEGQPMFVDTFWALVTGDKPRSGTFVSATTEEIPLLILRDPPGDGSTAFFEQGESYTFGIESLVSTSLTGEITTTLEAGIEFTAGTPFWSTDSDVELETVGGFEIGVSATVEGGIEFSVTTTESFSTSDEEVFVGPDADIYLGVALNVVFAKTDNLSIDPETCEIIRTQSIRIGGDNEKPFETVYLYSDSHIANYLIPQLKEFAIADPDQATYWTSAALNWQSHLDLNDSLRVEALVNPVENRSFNAGAEYSYSIETEDVESYAWDVGVFTEIERSIEVGFSIAGSGAKTKFGLTLSAEAHRGEYGETANVITTGYSMSDSDPGDFFTYDVGMDPVYGTPVFGLRSGRSSCPWEAGTQPRDSVVVAVEPATSTGVPADEPAEIILSITNWSPSDDAREYQVRMIQASNPFGAIVKLNGAVLDGSQSFFIDPQTTQVATLTVERGPSRFNYQNLRLQVVAPCEYELWEAGGTLAVACSTDFHVSFDTPCSDIAMLQPTTGWVYNQSSAAESDSLDLKLVDFEVDISETETILALGAQYRQVGQETWINVGETVVDSIQFYPEGHANEYEPMGVTLPWNVGGINDGSYQIRPFTRCEYGVYRGAQASGLIDRQPPQVLGVPEPSDNVLSLGDDIAITFNEPIYCDSVSVQSVKLWIEDPGDDIPVEITTICNGQKIIIVPVSPTIATLEGETLIAKVLTAVADIAGNPLTSDVTWSFDVVRSDFAWRDAELYEEVSFQTTGTVTGTLVNGTDVDRDFELDDVASWLIPDITTGSIVEGGEQLIAFSVDNTLPIGTHIDTLVVNSPPGMNPEIISELEIRVDVVCAPPNWVVDPADFENTMTAVIELTVGGQISTDTDDLIAAFVGNELRGVGSPEDVPGIGSRVFLNIYSERAGGETIRFKVFDADQCHLYSSSDSFMRYVANRRRGTPEQPEVIVAADGIPATVQAIDVNEGWTWFSLNYEDNLDMSLATILSDLNPAADDIVKSDTLFALFDPDIGWVGSLTDLDMALSYAINLSETGTIYHTGQVVPPDSVLIPLVDYWNWIGSPSTSQLVNDALGNLVATDADVIKSQYGFAEYVASTGQWVGSMTTMEPGVGYKLYVASAMLSGNWLTYPVLNPFARQAPTVFAPLDLQTTDSGENRPDWHLSAGHQFNMTITARIEVGGHQVDTSGGLIAAFVGDELRGVGSITPVDALDAHYTFLMVQSDGLEGEDVTFRFYDPQLDAVLEVVEQMNFVADETVGSLRSPFVFHTDAIDPGPGELPLSFNLAPHFPNPTLGGAVSIRWALPSTEHVNLQLFDVQGREVMSLVNEVMEPGWYNYEVNADRLSQGVYFYRLNAGPFQQSRRLVVLRKR